MGELAPPAGEKVAEADLVALARALNPEGQALILTIEKVEREWIESIAARRRLSIHRLVARDGHVILRLTP